MTKTTHNGSINFHASVKTYIQPLILDQYIDDDGELQYVLDNNRTTPASKYNALWLPIKGTVNMKGKGDNIGNKQARY